MPVLIGQKIDFIEDEYQATSMTVAEPVPQLVEAASARTHPEQVSKDLETRVVFATVHIENFDLASRFEKALDVLDDQRLARATAAKDE